MARPRSFLLTEKSFMDYDIIVIGAGPAGMASATTAAKYGAKVLLLDDQPAPGGQIYRDSDSRASC